MKTILTIAALLFTITANANPRYTNNSGAKIGSPKDIVCNSAMSCSMTPYGVLTLGPSGTFTGDVIGDGGDQLYGFRQEQTVATATTITVAQCGQTFINAGAVQMELPEASAALGCRLTFITGNATNFDLNPDNADQILVQTNAVGDAIRNATLGNAITIEAISASQWAPVAVSGTWTDIN